MQNSRMPDLRAQGKKPLISSTSVQPLPLTHKVIHRKCVELFALDNCCRTGYFRQRKMPCYIFAHGNKVHRNQALSIACMALRTILSTKNVQNSGAAPELSTETAGRSCSCTPFSLTGRTCCRSLPVHTSQ